MFEICVSGDEVRTKWKNLRDYYNEIKKRQKIESRSGQGATPGQPAKKKAKKIWAMYEFMKWTDSYKSQSE